MFIRLKTPALPRGGMTDAAVGPGSCQASGSGGFDGQAFKFQIQTPRRSKVRPFENHLPQWLIEGFFPPYSREYEAVRHWTPLEIRDRIALYIPRYYLRARRFAFCFDVASRYRPTTYPTTVHRARPDDREGGATAVARGRHI